MILSETKTLSNNISIPLLGLGTWMIPNEETAKAVQSAIKLGYRHIDTAEAYENEEGVGKGIKECGLPREELFITTKLRAEFKTYEKATGAIDESLRKLNSEYIDLMLIHSPEPWNDFHGGNYDEGNLQAWHALEEAYQAGKLKAIGVSNFRVKDIENILNHGTIKPMVNQVLMHIGNTPEELLSYCKEKNILVEAYSPVAHGAILHNEAIESMAAKYNVSVAQLCIRYCIQRGVVVLPKTANPEHMKENANVDFEISEEDMEILKSLSCRDYGEYSYFPVFSGK